MIGGYRLLGIESTQRVPIVNAETEAAVPLPSPGLGVEWLVDAAGQL